MIMNYAPCCSQNSRVCIWCLESRERELNWSHWGAYIDSTSNIVVREKAVRQKVITPVKPVLPLAIVGLTNECIFSASELAVGDQLMISFNCVGSTDEHSWSESRKMLSVGMDRRFQLYHWFNRWAHLVTLCQWECIDVVSFRNVCLTGEHILSHSVNGNAPV
jgi:hypothetical protein